MFSVGDLVSYPMHGVGMVEAVEERTVLGETSYYYLLRFLSGRMTAMVPVQRAGEVGLRPLIPAEGCEKVLAIMQAEPCTENDNWNQRYRDNYTKLKGGDIYEVAEVVNCLMHREAERGLSAGERKMLLTARQVLLMELSTASGRPEEEFYEVVGEK